MVTETNPPESVATTRPAESRTEAEAEQWFEEALAAVEDTPPVAAPPAPAAATVTEPVTPTAASPTTAETPPSTEESTEEPVEGVKPTPEPPAAPQQPTIPAGQLRRLQEENYGHRHAAQTVQDNQEIVRLAEQWRAQRIQEGWDEESAKAAAATLASTARQGAQEVRDRKIFQDAAFYAGKEHSLSLDQVQQLSGSRSRDEFAAIVRSFTDETPTTREQYLLAENKTMQDSIDTLKTEMEELKKNVVPTGQRFGDMPGTGNAQRTTNVSEASTQALNDGVAPSDELWADISSFFEGE